MLRLGPPLSRELLLLIVCASRWLSSNCKHSLCQKCCIEKLIAHLPIDQSDADMAALSSIACPFQEYESSYR